ncbi:hypothetical protein H6P81_002383 [Aristolochia fimbriata]|uniref:Uncharacterized protein n=1 Tax=Aristolochia fimbriata TaxID=158543 RepID=A0AAV7F9M3_ARIFI|nr:hypothetical protein H6P81_002383 [Aristolochia fimbriata]
MMDIFSRREKTDKHASQNCRSVQYIVKRQCQLQQPCRRQNQEDDDKERKKRWKDGNLSALDLISGGLQPVTKREKNGDGPRWVPTKIPVPCFPKQLYQRGSARLRSETKTFCRDMLGIQGPVNQVAVIKFRATIPVIISVSHQSHHLTVLSNIATDALPYPDYKRATQIIKHMRDVSPDHGESSVLSHCLSPAVARISEDACKD